MSGIIDYAGLFPPADLDLETALANYDAYLHGGQHWMLGNFIVPSAKLVSVYADPEFHYSVIVSPKLWPEEVEQLSMFKGSIKVVEICLPPSKAPPFDYPDTLHHLELQLSRTGLTDILVFIESAYLDAAVTAIANFNHNNARRDLIRSMGFKLRCGGLKNSAYPDIERVAATIATCCKLDVPIKFTAGMHHPLRNYSESLNIMQHGFLNIFGAALLYANRQLTKQQVQELLKEETMNDLTFTDDGFSWKSHFISAATIRSLRAEKVISFGSCSFTEPLQGIRDLGLL